ncbi:MAG: hypothetical protein QW745_08145 [Thermoplasmata archaeon]
MDFRTALKELDRIEKLVGGEGVSPRDFADFCSVKMPVRNATVYLQRLYKMNLASRKKAKNYNYNFGFKTKKPYLYKVSKQGHKYLNWLNSPEKQFSDKRKYIKLVKSLFQMDQYDLENLKHDLLFNKYRKSDKYTQIKFDFKFDDITRINLITLIHEILKKKFHQ